MADAAKLAFQINLFVVILGYGLTARFSDVTYVLRLPDLLARSLLAVHDLPPVNPLKLKSTAEKLVGFVNGIPEIGKGEIVY